MEMKIAVSFLLFSSFVDALKLSTMGCSTSDTQGNPITVAETKSMGHNHQNHVISGTSEGIIGDSKSMDHNHQNHVASGTSEGIIGDSKSMDHNHQNHVTSGTSEEIIGDSKSMGHNRHHIVGRYRRTVGQKTRCISEIKHFCKIFKHGKIVKNFCLSVNVENCTALDK